MKQVFKISVSNRKNLNALLETNLWATPTVGGAYSALSKKAEVGDRVIFTHAGEPVVVGELATLPSDSVQTIWPDGGIYANTFVVDIQGHGRIKRKLRDKANISFKRGVLNLSDNKTFNKCLKRLNRV